MLAKLKAIDAQNNHKLIKSAGAVLGAVLVTAVVLVVLGQVDVENDELIGEIIENTNTVQS